MNAGPKDGGGIVSCLCGAATHTTGALGPMGREWRRSQGALDWIAMAQAWLRMAFVRANARQNDGWAERVPDSEASLSSEEPRARPAPDLPRPPLAVFGARCLVGPTVTQPYTRGRALPSPHSETPSRGTQYSPEGRRLKAYLTFSPLSLLTTMVWPALLPPAQRAQTSASAARMSTSLPLPSSPHWEPRLAVSVVYGGVVEVGPWPCAEVRVTGEWGWVEATTRDRIRTQR